MMVELWLVDDKLPLPNPEFQSRYGWATVRIGERFDNLYQVVGNELWVPRARLKYVARKNVVELCLTVMS